MFWNNGYPQITFGTPGEIMATIERRPRDEEIGCTHCVWAHNKTNLWCPAATGVPLKRYPNGTLVDMTTGDPLKGTWQFFGNVCKLIKT